MLQMKRIYFDKMDSISMLTFLKDFRNTYNKNGIQEEVATWPISYLIRNSASSSLKARLTRREIHATGPLTERPSSYINGVNNLFTTSTSDDVTASGTDKSRVLQASLKSICSIISKETIHSDTTVWYSSRGITCKSRCVVKAYVHLYATICVCILDSTYAHPWLIWHAMSALW